jgi:hypothetical protein
LPENGNTKIWEDVVPPEDIFLLTLVVAAFAAFAVALAYGSAIASGTEEAPPADSTKSRQS